MRFLLTNDDGVSAPGLTALVSEIRKLGEVVILAPDKNWSGGGHVKTLDRPLRVKEMMMSDGTIALASDGAPSDCVALALLGYFSEKIDMVISGINHGANIGHDVTYSGTVTAAMEAVIWGTPAVALSLDATSNNGAKNFGPAAIVARQIIETMMRQIIPPEILLNVNIPYMPIEMIKGIRITRQGLRVYRDRLEQRMDPRGKPYYWIAGDVPLGVATDGTDYGAISEGFVSITPLQLDLTDFCRLDQLNALEFKLNCEN